MITVVVKKITLNFLILLNTQDYEMKSRSVEYKEDVLECNGNLQFNDNKRPS